MDWCTMIKNWYDKGYWTKEQVKVAQSKGKISETEYIEITGDAKSFWEEK